MRLVPVVARAAVQVLPPRDRRAHPGRGLVAPVTSPVLRLEIPMEPVSKARPRVVNGHAYTPARTARAEAVIRAAWDAAGRPRLPELPLALEVVASFERPASHYRRDGRLSATGRRAIPGGVRDWDNLAKAASDALNHLAWRDDRLICWASVEKRFTTRGEAPSLRITGWAPHADDVARPA